MKVISVTSLIFCLLMGWNAHALNLSESVQKLQRYSANDLKISETRTEEEVNSKLQEMLQAIEKSAGEAIKEKKEVSLELLQQLTRVSVITFQADPSEAAAELLLPLYQKQKKAFDKALKNLPPKERAELLDSLKNAVREESEGNG